jgi:hypothetical protein
MQVAQCDLSDHPDLKKFKHCFSIRDIVFAAKSEEEKAEWMAAMKKVQHETTENRLRGVSISCHNGNNNHIEVCGTPPLTVPSPLAVASHLGVPSPLAISSPLGVPSPLAISSPLAVPSPVMLDEQSSSEVTKLVSAKSTILQQLTDVENKTHKRSDSKQLDKGLIALRDKLAHELEVIDKRLHEIENTPISTSPTEKTKGGTFPRNVAKNLASKSEGGSLESKSAPAPATYNGRASLSRTAGGKLASHAEASLVEGSMSLSELQLKMWRITSDNSEAYLTDGEFKRAFHVTSREEFYSQPKWKQELQKKELKLL